MKSLGDTLKSAREEREISIDQAIYGTNISRNFIEALENENFKEFPAEAYLVGFLKIYAEYLGLDAEKTAGMYRSYKLSEDPTPIKELLGTPKNTSMRKIAPWILIALVLLSGGFFGIPWLIKTLNIERENNVVVVVEDEKPATKREIRPSIPLWEGAVHNGDTLILEDDLGELILTVSDANGRLLLDASDAGQWPMLLGEEIYLPSSNGLPMWRMYLKDIGLPNGGAILEIQQLTETVQEENLITSVDIGPPTGNPENLRQTQIIRSAQSPEAFNLDIVFQDFCLFRYRVDNQDSVENYYTDGESFRLEVGRSITIWTSNAGAIYAKTSGEDIVLGNRGEVAVGQIRWFLDTENGDYNLTLVPLS